jgi:pantoate--beta-alanine ligase
LALSQALFAARDAAAEGVDAARSAATERLEAAPGLKVDYVALVDPATLGEIDEQFTGDALMMVAGTVGSTRLIDNLPFAVGSAS